MSRAPIALFVDRFFTRALFQPDDGLAAKALAEDLSPEASIVINGNELSPAVFVGFLKSSFRATATATVLAIKDLDVVPGADGQSGVVAQHTQYKVTAKDSGKETLSSATTIVRVGVVDGRQVVTGLWEAQSDRQQ